ncbi:helix-turn-helix domain-containing protein [Sphaerisporangium sp. NBC_01403]|uniref:hypothetical protein n=1 Tax=Sphaerisporangium sp. NBC_01403 TaxID=2903599 RepID=UPI00324F8B99
MLVSAHLSPDGEQFLTRKQAAEQMGVHPDTITTWVRNGYLTALDGCPPRRQMYARSDVEHAEKLAYEAALRTSGSGKRVERNLAA